MARLINAIPSRRACEVKPTPSPASCSSARSRPRRYPPFGLLRHDSGSVRLLCNSSCTNGDRLRDDPICRCMPSYGCVPSLPAGFPLLLHAPSSSADFTELSSLPLSQRYPASLSPSAPSSSHLSARSRLAFFLALSPPSSTHLSATEL